MTSREDLDVDDDFSELYKEYTGPLGSSAPNASERTITNKRSHGGSDEEEEVRDPNAVPTDFTSREAKVWEAKSKATERNWKKRKEEEMICKICGESGHFTQGCPTTLGANRKSQDFFERVPAREPHIKALFPEKVVSKIEEDIGCKVKIEEKFIIVSGKDRLILKKGVDAVHKIKEGENKGALKFSDEGGRKGSSNSPISRSRSPERRSPVTSRLGRSNSQKSNPSPHSASPLPHRYSRPDKVVEDRVREDLQKLPGGSPQAYGSDGGRSRSSRSKSPSRPSYVGNSYSSYDGHSQGRSGYRTDGWTVERGGSDTQSGRNVEFPSFPRTLEDLEIEYKKEAMELSKFRDKEEDEENFKHRESMQDIRESHMKKLAMLNGTHISMWEEFLQLEGQKGQQKARPRLSSPGFGGYKQTGYPEFNNSSGNFNHSGPTIPVDPRDRYPNALDSYTSSRPHETYGQFQRHRRDFGKTYNRY